MENTTERAMGHLFGFVGGLLIAVGGLVAVVYAIADAAVGRTIGAADALSEAIILFVVGALVLLFSHMGEHTWKDRPLTSGVLLVVLAIVAWSVLGLSANVLALVGGIFALVAGVLYLIEPTKRAATALASTG